MRTIQHRIAGQTELQENSHRIRGGVGLRHSIRQRAKPVSEEPYALMALVRFCGGGGGKPPPLPGLLLLLIKGEQNEDEDEEEGKNEGNNESGVMRWLRPRERPP